MRTPIPAVVRALRWAIVASVSLCVGLTLRPRTLTAQTSQVVNGEVRQALFTKVGTNVQMPLDVLMEIAKGIAESNESSARRRQFIQGSRLRTSAGRREGEDSLELIHGANSLDLLLTLQVSPLLIVDRTVTPRSQLLRSVNVTLEAIRPGLERQVQQANAGADALRREAIRMVRASVVAPATQEAAAEAAVRLSSLATPGKELTKEADAELIKCLTLFNSEAQKVLRMQLVRADGAVGDVQAVVQATREMISGLAGISGAGSIAVPIRGLEVQSAVHVVQAMGALKDARRQFVENIGSQAQSLRDGLERERAAYESVWTRSFEAAQKAVIDNVALPAEVRALGPIVRNVQELRGVLNNDGTVDVAAGTKWLSAVGVLPRDMASPEVANTIAAIAAGKADLSSSTAVVAKLVASHVDIPAVKEAAQLVGTASSLMQAAGPLLAVSGWGAGLAAFQAVGGFGGLGGGGSSNAAEFAALNQKLDQISAKLDVVISKLDQLDAKMTAQHADVMNALEGLSFDVERTRQLLLGLAHQNVRGPCRAVLKTQSVSERERFTEDCHKALSFFYAAEPVPGPLTLRINLETTSLQDNALKALTEETVLRRRLADLAPQGYCASIVFPSRRVEDLRAKVSRHQGTGGCTDVLLGTQLLEPGIVAEYIETELDAFKATSALGSSKSILWWKARGPVLHKRWSTQLLDIANRAVAQQAAMMGDVFLPSMAQRLSSLDAQDVKVLAQIWRENSALATNAIRVWLATRLELQAMPRTRYALAFLSDDTRLWYEVTGAKTVEVLFRKEEGKTDADDKWLVKFASLPEVQLPKPDELMDLQLQWPTGLERVVRARNELMETVVSMAAVVDATKTTAGSRELLELAAVTALSR